MPLDDVTRLRAEYADRERRLSGSDIYSPFNTASLFAAQQRQRSELAILRRNGFHPLRDRLVLEIGCGAGGVLLNYLGYGATPGNLHGVELLTDRVEEARARLPHVPIICGDAQELPYESASFDLVLQYTVFSSILDEGIRANISHEMRRVLKPDGTILWYDFWLNPTNPQTRGIRPQEIRRQFPDCQCEFHRVTLAPPITRRLARYSWLACYLLERLQILNTHYMVAIRPA